VFGDGVLRKVYRTERGVVAGYWRKLHKEELLDFYCLLEYQIKEVEMEENRYSYRPMYLVKKYERHHLEDLGVDGRTILKSILNKWDRMGGVD
jgi:hypothetical protein